ncbi:MAG: hypothetical protein II954_04415 [Synergistaceae bacterium]|nr:hypothetical protein [Synergistaceae bacterium]
MNSEVSCVGAVDYGTHQPPPNSGSEAKNSEVFCVGTTDYGTHQTPNSGSDDHA